MSGKSSIEWTDATWNPVTGCNQISPGCGHCYAKEIHDMRHKAYLGGAQLPPQYAVPFEEVQLHPGRVTAPLHWRKPRMIFVNSMSDLFHESVPFEFIDKVFAVMNATVFTLPIKPTSTRWHTYQVLTKRPDRMKEYMESRRTVHFAQGEHPIFEAGRGNDGALRGQGGELMNAGACLQWPPPNVWLGVSVEDQKRADERIPFLLDTPAAVRFLSCEPLLGPVNLSRYVFDRAAEVRKLIRGPMLCNWDQADSMVGESVNWVIVGGESGRNARACRVSWIESIVEQCRAAHVPPFVKQLGSNPIEVLEGLQVGIPQGGGRMGWIDSGATAQRRVPGIKDSKGGDWDEWPDTLRVRYFPETAAV